MLLTTLITINLFFLSLFDLKYRKIPVLLILSLLILTLLSEPKLASFVYITSSSTLIYSIRKIQLGDLLVISILAIQIPISKLTYFLFILTLSSLIISLFYRFLLGTNKAPMIPCLLLSWILIS